MSRLSPALDLPDYATRWFLVACAIGFPVWLAFAWFYEFTPQGFRCDAEVAVDAPVRTANARKLDFAIIGVLLAAVVLLASGYAVRRGGPSVAVAASAFDPPADSIVVLPFTNLDHDPKQRYFSDGITEELTGAIGQTSARRVIAWDPASRYRGVREQPRAIGEALDVANILHGSIERQGDQVRVMAELVDARTGVQIWSAHYDDLLANVFTVQDRISAAIAQALKVKFASLGAARSVDPEAHDLVLKARALLRTAQTAAPIDQARALFERAIAIDPDYADAHAGLAGAWLDLIHYSTLPLAAALPRMRVEADEALTIDPRNVDALVTLGNADASQGLIADARARLGRARAIDPSNAVAHVAYGNLLPLAQSLAQEREAVRLDPDNATAQNDLAATELDLGDFSGALAPALALLKLAPHSADNALVLAETCAPLRRGADAVRAFDLAQPDTPIAQALVATGRLTYQSIQGPALRTQALAAVDALRERRDLAPDSVIDVVQLYLALGENGTALHLLPGYCAATPVGCTDLSVNPLFVPLRGQPHLQALIRQYDTVSRPAPAGTAAPAA